MIEGPGRGRDATVFDLVGGQAWFDQLVEWFYEGAETDAILRPMYPDDLADPKRHLALFLAQYWGGPSTYHEERGHPRLGMRHARFAVDAAAAEAWLTHMKAALAKMDPPAEIAAAMVNHFEGAAHFLINTG